MENNKNYLLEQAVSLLEDVEKKSPIKGTHEWYLSNNLKQFLKSVEEAKNPVEILRASELLSRYCTESMDWDTEIYKKCIAISNIGFRLAKEG